MKSANKYDGTNIVYGRVSYMPYSKSISIPLKHFVARVSFCKCKECGARFVVEVQKEKEFVSCPLCQENNTTSKVKEVPYSVVKSLSIHVCATHDEVVENPLTEHTECEDGLEYFKIYNTDSKEAFDKSVHNYNAIGSGYIREVLREIDSDLVHFIIDPLRQVLIAFYESSREKR